MWAACDRWRRSSREPGEPAVIDVIDHQRSLPEVSMTVHLHELIQASD
jgi:hypothetical protein